MSKIVLLKNVRLAFPSLYEPTAYKDGEKKYQATLILEEGDPQIEMLRLAIAQVATQRWGRIPPGFLPCLRDGSAKEVDGFGPGTWFLNAKSKTKPSVYGANNELLAAQDGIVYGGCYVHARIELYAFDGQGQKRVNAGLSGLKFAKDGEPFAGGRKARPEDFGDYEAPAGSDDDFLGGF